MKLSFSGQLESFLGFSKGGNILSMISLKTLILYKELAVMFRCGPIAVMM